MMIDATLINATLKALLLVGLSAGLAFLSIHMLIRKLEEWQVREKSPH